MLAKSVCKEMVGEKDKASQVNDFAKRRPKCKSQLVESVFAKILTYS